MINVLSINFKVVKLNGIPQGYCRDTVMPRVSKEIKKMKVLKLQ